MTSLENSLVGGIIFPLSHSIAKYIREKTLGSHDKPFPENTWYLNTGYLKTGYLNTGYLNTGYLKMKNYDIKYMWKINNISFVIAT